MSSSPLFLCLNSIGTQQTFVICSRLLEGYYLSPLGDKVILFASTQIELKNYLWDNWDEFVTQLENCFIEIEQEDL